jgi:hypothetical protein
VCLCLQGEARDLCCVLLFVSSYTCTQAAKVRASTTDSRAPQLPWLRAASLSSRESEANEATHSHKAPSQFLPFNTAVLKKLQLQVESGCSKTSSVLAHSPLILGASHAVTVAPVWASSRRLQQQPTHPRAPKLRHPLRHGRLG